jgi:group I intron endonuclease
MSNRKFTIYQITNKINGKSYIGFDSNYPNRIRRHKRCDGSSPLLDNAVKKYGWVNFTVKVLYEGKHNTHTLNVKEPYYIKKLKTKRPLGYNLTDGGEGRLGYHHSKETKRKLSTSLKGR